MTSGYGGELKCDKDGQGTISEYIEGREEGKSEQRSRNGMNKWAAAKRNKSGNKYKRDRPEQMSKRTNNRRATSDQGTKAATRTRETDQTR
jgi:hypothetical protein